MGLSGVVVMSTKSRPFIAIPLIAFVALLALIALSCSVTVVVHPAQAGMLYPRLHIALLSPTSAATPPQSTTPIVPVTGSSTTTPSSTPTTPAATSTATATATHLPTHTLTPTATPTFTPSATRAPTNTRVVRSPTPTTTATL